MHKKGCSELCTLYERITELCAKKNVSRSKMCLELGLSKSTMSNMKSGRQVGISTETAQKIASYFNVTVGYLLGESEIESKKEDAVSDIFAKIYNNEKIQKATSLLCELNDEQLDIVIAMISNFK